LIIIKNEIDGMVLSVPTAPVLGVPSNQISKNVGTMETLDMNSVPITVLLIKLI
jgi:phosphoribosylcarboxyaminoimidazole (NCAIR) mutase